MTSTIRTETTPSIWNLDPAHTLVEFSAKHMVFTTVKGLFKKVEATIYWNEADIAQSSVEATIDATSIYSGQDQRDGHLVSPDFLDVANYPTITFKSTRIEPVTDDFFRIFGDLTVRGVTREVLLETAFDGRGTDPYGNEKAAFSGKAKLNRKDFGLTWNVALETGGVLVGENINIELHLELNRQKAAQPTA